MHQGRGAAGAGAMPASLVAALAERLPDNEERVRPLMQLAVVDADGGPSIRSVLLTAWDGDGFLFNTDWASRRAGEIGSAAVVALCIVVAGGQVAVRGTAALQTAEEERAAYAARTPYLKQLAWLNTPMLAAAGREERRRVWADFAAARDPATLEPPPTWTGYRVHPTRVTLWTADEHGPSSRREHTLAGGRWSDVDLPG